MHCHLWAKEHRVESKFATRNFFGDDMDSKVFLSQVLLEEDKNKSTKSHNVTLLIDDIEYVRC